MHLGRPCGHWQGTTGGWAHPPAQATYSTQMDRTAKLDTATHKKIGLVAKVFTLFLYDIHRARKD